MAGSFSGALLAAGLVGIATPVAAFEVFEFDTARVLAELNETDGDLGFQVVIDGEPWKSLDIKNPRGKVIFSIRERSALRRLGLTEFSFESNEPTFDDQSPEAFFAAFAEGIYKIGAVTIDGDRLRADSFLSHALPAPVGNVTVSGTAFDEDCEAGPPVEVAVPARIEFDPVTTSHPTIGRQAAPLEVEFYEVVIEGDEVGLIASYILSPDETGITIPAELTDTGEDLVKYQILVQATNGNRTSIESCFAPAG